jgi:hypothetical protein
MLRLRGWRILLVQHNIRSWAKPGAGAGAGARARAGDGLRFAWDQWCDMYLSMKNFQSNLRVHDPHHYLCLKQRISQLWVLKQHISSFLVTVLHTELHLFHQLKHLLRGKTSDCSGNRFGGIFWIDGVAIG